MKKTLLLCALLSSVLAAPMVLAAETIYTTSAGLGDPNYYLDADNNDTADLVYGYGNYGGFQFSISTASFHTDTSSTYNGSTTSSSTGESFSTGATLSLTSMVIFERQDSYYDFNGVLKDAGDAADGVTTIIIVDSTGTIVAVSDAVSIEAERQSGEGAEVDTETYTDPATGYTREVGATLTFNFEDAELIADELYTAYFSNSYTVEMFESGTEFNYTTDIVKVGICMSAGLDSDWQAVNTTNASADTVTLQDTNYAATAMVITTSAESVIPEPSTATLSLLALGGLMLRRRRTA